MWWYEKIIAAAVKTKKMTPRKCKMTYCVNKTKTFSCDFVEFNSKAFTLKCLIF